MFSSMSYEQKFLFSLLLTLIVEIPIVFSLARYFYGHKEIKILKIVSIGFISSALTLPYFWFVLPVFISDRNAYMFGGELLIIFIESAIYCKLLRLKLSEAFVISLIANIASVFLGLAI